MATFDQARTDQLQAQAALLGAQAAAAAAAQNQLGLMSALAQLDRQLTADDAATVAQRQQLEARLRAADEQVTQAKAAAATAAQQARAAAEGFASFTDPRENVGRLPDTSPFALFPVRLETRFASSQGTPQLLVRIYPDDCSIDTFEPMLSATELANGRRYWQNVWRAGGVEGDDRAAWADLVAAHGSGRAGYIVATYVPANLADVPAKAQPTDEILVIPTQDPLPAADAAAIGAYWVAVWQSTDAAGQEAAAAALAAAVGHARATQLRASYVPFNLTDAPAPPLTPQAVVASADFIIFPPDPPTKQAPWTQAPQLRQFPERFVVLGYIDGEVAVQAIGGLVTLPLDVGPDPSVDPGTDPDLAIHPTATGDLFVPIQLNWLVDFQAAEAVGMGISIPLTPAQAETGFDRLIVLGLQMAANGQDGAAALEELLSHHLVGRAGLSLVPQGTPTHNTSGTGAGYTMLDNADESFDDRRNQPLFTITPDVWSKRDGQWLAESLGVSPALMATVHASGGQDQAQAKAMQRALWPATLGYWIDKMMTPVLGADVVSATYDFFTRYVSGRGPLPALRIGGQPYGVLPTTAFSRIGWLGDNAVNGSAVSTPDFLSGLRTLATAAGTAWSAMSSQAAYVGASGDPQQTLLDVLGLYPSSVEYYSRTAESISELFNVQNLWGAGLSFYEKLRALNLDGAAAGLLRQLGYTGQQEPAILQYLFMIDAGQLTTIIDDQPLSETSPIRSYTDDGRNYLTWLIDAAQTSFDALAAEQGFTGDVSPQALLYLLLRQALMLGYYDTASSLNQAAGTISQDGLLALKPEPPFIHVDASAPASESRFGLLYAAEPAITSSPDMLVSDYITANLAGLPEAAILAGQLTALGILAPAATAQLERAFAEHVDLCCYRYDSWLLGLVNYQLEQMRTPANSKGAVAGIYLGAYAWLEDLRPSTAKPGPAQMTPSLAATYAGGTPVLSDPANGGYVHAPSLQHATTAAILRSGYLANATSANAQSLAVNLSSDRVRNALAVLEGIRNGQSLGALLGYQFERGLHDDYQLAEVDAFIYPLRKAFPLVADSLAPTATPPDVPIEAIEARNVLDGRKLADYINSSGNATYPFGLTTLPAASPAQAAAITAEANGLLDTYDAIADLALAEGVHQAAQGNFERIAGTLDAYTTGNFPPDPEVAQTPPAGMGLTHRVALHLRPGLTAAANATPAARAEPAVDSWLRGILPPLDGVGCTVTWTDPVSHANHSMPVTLANLGVSPIDVLDLVLPDDTQAMTQLDDRVIAYVLNSAHPRPDADLAIRYLTAPPGGLSVFEVSALIRTARTLLTRSRPLRATDATLSNQATAAANTTVSLDKTRITGLAADLVSLGADIATFLGTLAPLIADPATHRATILAEIDTYAARTVTLLQHAAGFRLPAAGWGFAISGLQSAFAALIAQVSGLVQRWTGKLAEFDTAIAAYDALPAATADSARFAALQSARALLATSLQALPATPAIMRAALDTTRTSFVTRLDQFVAVQSTTSTSFSATLAALTALLPVSDVDNSPFDVTPLGDRAVLLARQLSASLTSQAVAIGARTAAAQAQLTLHDAATTAEAAVAALQAAAAELLGEDFVVVPEFTLTTAQGNEWANAVSASNNGSLLSYLINTAGISRPVDEWMHGAARVRAMLKAWETTTLLVEALRGPADVPALLPVQFPYQAGTSWVAMQFAPGDLPDSDRLCYTAHYSTPFDKSAPQCGLLLDEWTEIIPATQRTTGITFNFARPDNEPPQAILLVTPASATGTWQWDDLVGALNETLELARVRAVEPAHIDETPYSMYLPATITASALYGISIVTSLCAANGVMTELRSTDA